MTTPNLSLSEVASNSLQPSVAINDSLQVLDALVQGRVQDKDLTAPPTTVSGDVGKVWIVGAGATGAWATHDGELALCTAATVWRFFTPLEGWRFDIIDEDAQYRYSGSAWAEVAAGSGGGSAAVITDATTARDVLPADAGGYLRFTSTGAKTATFDSADGFAADEEYHITNRAASGNLTLTAAGTTTLNAPKGGTLVLEPGDTVTVKFVDTDEADVFGSTEAA